MKFYKCNMCGITSAETELIGHGECPTMGCGDSIKWPGNMVVEIINCTPHPINIVGLPEIPASGILPRCNEDREKISEISGIKINRCNFGNVENLPEAQEKTILIVSRVVCDEKPYRKDLFFPDEIVRNEKGHITGCKALGSSSRTFIEEVRAKETAEKTKNYIEASYTEYDKRVMEEYENIVYIRNDIPEADVNTVKGVYFGTSGPFEAIDELIEKYGNDAVLDDDGEVWE